MNDALEEVYAIDMNTQSRTQGRHLMCILTRLEMQGDFRAIDEVLRTIDLKKLGVHALIGLVRCPINAKDQLPSWQSTYEKCWSELRNRGKDPKAAFVGMQELTWL